MNLLTALELAGNYPDNILITSLEREGKFGILCYMKRDGFIHKLMLDSEPTFDSAKDAERTMHNIAKEVCEKYKNFNL